MSSLMVGIVGFVAILVLIMFMKFPIGFSMILVGVAGIAYLTSIDTAVNMLGRQVLTSAASYDMAVVAMFILMGEMAFNVGISNRAFETAYKWLGMLRGGLAMATIGACSAFAAVCGSSPATAATVGSISIAEMKKYGYSDELATGSVAAGGVLGILIPPSVGFILLGLLTEQSISTLYMAGIVPGILLTILFMIVAYIMATIKPSSNATMQSFTMREKLLSLKGLIEVVVIFVVCIGGLIFGFFTPTEAGAVGVVAVLIAGLIKRTFGLKELSKSLFSSTTMVGMVLTIFIGAMIFSNFLAASTLPFKIGEMISVLNLPPILIVSLIIILWLILGCIMDAIAMIMLTVPIVYPIVIQLGFDPIVFCVLGVIAIEAGLITPPIGMNVYIIAGVAKDIPLHTIFKGAIPFLLSILILIVLIMVFPNIALFLPNILR
jgi:tripartite ATP-independent transporter DctM subunit